MISRLLFNKEHIPEKCHCKHKFHEMREKECDETMEHAHEFIKKAKRFRGGY